MPPRTIQSPRWRGARVGSIIQSQFSHLSPSLLLILNHLTQFLTGSAGMIPRRALMRRRALMPVLTIGHRESTGFRQLCLSPGRRLSLKVLGRRSHRLALPGPLFSPPKRSGAGESSTRGHSWVTERELEIVIEIPRGNRNKYEFDHERRIINLDRQLFSGTSYPADQGLVLATIAQDDDLLDPLALVEDPTLPGGTPSSTSSATRSGTSSRSTRTSNSERRPRSMAAEGTRRHWRRLRPSRGGERFHLGGSSNHIEVEP